MSNATRQARSAQAVEASIKGSVENWESGKLGLSEEHAVQETDEQLAELDDALELKLISIRLQKALIDQLKMISRFHGIGYQPLIRDVLNRFASHELVSIVNQIQDQKKAEKTLSDEDSPVAKFLRDCA